MEITNKAPEFGELEVSLFGPGVGEAACVHLGQGKWLLIDSCLNPNSGEPASLEYLKSLGVNPASDVVLIVVSHWHDDHVRGITKIAVSYTHLTLPTIYSV